jgi:hypothetical protein
MNPKIKQAYTDMLKELLAQCTEAEQMIFKRMYSHKNLELDINTVVDNMEESKYEWAIIQCEQTIAKKTPIKSKTLTKQNESTSNSSTG